MSDEVNQVRSFLEKHRVAKMANSREIRLTMQKPMCLLPALL